MPNDTVDMNRHVVWEFTYEGPVLVRLSVCAFYFTASNDSAAKWVLP